MEVMVPLSGVAGLGLRTMASAAGVGMPNALPPTIT